jgi:hypothetical protein
MNAVPTFVGTAPQWATFVISVALLVAVLKVLPALIRALNERSRDKAAAAAAGEATASAEWRELEGRVSNELAECQRAREFDGRHMKRLDDENFRLRIVVSMALAELEKLDPGSQILLKAQAIMALPLADPEQETREKERLAELLARVDAPERPKRARQRRARPRRG